MAFVSFVNKDTCGVICACFTSLDGLLLVLWIRTLVWKWVHQGVV